MPLAPGLFSLLMTLLVTLFACMVLIDHLAEARRSRLAGSGRLAGRAPGRAVAEASR